MMLARSIKSELQNLDLKPNLDIKIVPCIKGSTILSDGNDTSNFPKDSKVYIITASIDSLKRRSHNLEARIIANRAIRIRAQTVIPDIDLFGKDVLISRNFADKIKFLRYRIKDARTLDAEIVARIGGYLYSKDTSLKECQEFLTLDASQILEKYGEAFIIKSMDI